MVAFSSVFSPSVLHTIIDALCAHRREWIRFVRVGPDGSLEAYSNNGVSDHALIECRAIDAALEALGVNL